MKLVIALLALITFNSFALTTGEVAPDFTLPGENKDISLKDFKGKIVVLEWLNHGCPFVRKQYDSGNMQALQTKYRAKDITWLSIISSAQGKQGYSDKAQAQKDRALNKSLATHILRDDSGKVGKLYGAKTTPHMYIIDPSGKLVYQGAIDDQPDTDKASIAIAKNYVSEALDEILAGKKVTAHTTKSYGCTVKY